VVVVAGNRENGRKTSALAGLISARGGRLSVHPQAHVGRGRAKLFADAAVKKFDEAARKRSGSRVPPIKPHFRESNRGVLIGGRDEASVGVIVGCCLGDAPGQGYVETRARPRAPAGASRRPAGRNLRLLAQLPPRRCRTIG